MGARRIFKCKSGWIADMVVNAGNLAARAFEIPQKQRRVLRTACGRGCPPVI